MKDLLDIQVISDNKPGSCMAIDDMPLAYSYVPYQRFETPYEKEKALKVGTIFPSLNKPLGVYGKEFFQKAGANNL